MATEHTFEDVYASSAAAVDRPTGVRRRIESAGHATPGAWPFSAPAFEVALDIAHDAVVIIDRSGTVRYANGACKALLERARPEGRHMREILGRGLGEDPRFLRNVLHRLHDSEIWRGVASVDVQGKPRELELSVGPVKASGGGRTQGFSVVARPVSQRALQSRSGARDVFATLARVAGAIAHDFNNHIAVVLNYSFILLRDLRTDRGEREQHAHHGHHSHIEELQQAAWRAAEMAGDMLRFSGKGKDIRGPEPAALDVNDAVREARATLALIASSHGDLDIELCLSRKPCITKARQAQLEWLLLELTQRLRTRLGELAHLRISTSHAAAASGGEVLALHGKPSVRVQLDAFPAAQRDPACLRVGHIEPDAQNVQIAQNVTESGPKLSAQLSYELALHSLPGDGLRYAIDLPGL